MQLNISEWRKASVKPGEETVFAIGDVHGCSKHLETLLDGMKTLASETRRSRLVFTGDLIGKGPNGLSVLDQWASPDLASSFLRIDRLYGNHEQMMLLAIREKAIVSKAVAKWMARHGAVFIDELRAKTGMSESELTADLLNTGTSDAVRDQLQNLTSHVAIGNMVFVHGGIDPSLGVAASVVAPWDVITKNHWAWIKAPFLRHTGGFGDVSIVHGHTVPGQHRELSGRPDPHVLEFGRLSLDGGSTLTGIVMGAQFENGRYRLVSVNA